MAAPWQRAIVVGASSGIGAELVRQLAGDGTRVALVARRRAELENVARECGTDGRVHTYPHDVRNTAEVPALFQTICRDLGGLDLIIYAAGVMPRIGPDEYDFEKDEMAVGVNLLGAIAWLNAAAARFSRAGEGTILALSSVAGDRGRRGFPVYNASKAGLDTYLEALRNRLARHGVRVVTVKPGPVDTPMTQGLDRLPFLAPVSVVARQALRGARRGRSLVYAPRRWRPIMFVLRHIPSVIFRRLDL